MLPEAGDMKQFTSSSTDPSQIFHENSFQEEDERFYSANEDLTEENRAEGVSSTEPSRFTNPKLMHDDEAQTRIDMWDNNNTLLSVLLLRGRDALSRRQFERISEVSNPTSTTIRAKTSFSTTLRLLKRLFLSSSIIVLLKYLSYPFQRRIHLKTR